MLTLFITTLAFCNFIVTINGEYDFQPIRPDKDVLRKTGRALWENRHSVVDSAENEGLISDETASSLRDYYEQETNLKDGEPEEFISCLQCRTLLSTLRGLINQGNTFDDIRDFAVDVCYNVTPSLGWNGEIMCEGMIDVFGPHVYWVLNETDKNPQEICQFHRTCPEDEEFFENEYPPNHFKARTYPKKETTSSKIYDPEHKKKRQIMKIAQITDVHLDENYSPGAPSSCDGLPVCCRDDLPGTGEAGEWGSYGCALAVPTLHHMLKFIADTGVDLVINTGDTPNHALWLETQEGQLRQSEILADGIREYIPGVPAFLTLGNHDSYPTNQFYGPSPLIKDLLHQLRLMYQDMANFTEEEIRTFEHGGYYTRVLMDGLRLVAYNSEYGYTDNYYGVLLEETPDWQNMTQWMEDTFNLARERNEKILLVSHHSQGGGFNFWHDFITDIMYRNGDLVMLHLFGHTHTDNYKMGLDDEGNAFHVNIITVAMQTSRNPSFRIFYVDTETMTPIDFENYYINISRPLEEGEEPLVELLYSASADYGMADLTPASFQEFTDRMEQDDDLFNYFRYNYETQLNPPSPCDDSCKKDFFCDRRTVSREEKAACMSAE